MTKLFDANIFKISYSAELTKVQGEYINKEIVMTNIKRMNLGMLIIALIEIIVILLNDLPKIFCVSQRHNLLVYGYLTLHLLLCIITSVSFVIFNNAIKKDTISSIKKYENIIYVVVWIILLILAFITGLDQYTTGQILVFAINIVFSGLAILIKSPYENIMYGSIYPIFILIMLIFQHNNEILISNLINGTVLFIAALYLSKFIYNNHFMHLVKNIKLEEINKKLEYLSDYDFLTDVPNRRYFKKQLGEMQKNSYCAAVSSIVIMDVDFFKNVNDTYGHLAGDYILKEMACILKTNIRDNDFVARFGGEEFLILLSNTSLEEAKCIAERLRETIQNYEFSFYEYNIKITSSFGITLIKDFSELGFERAYSLADKALYKAKKCGRNQVCEISVDDIK